MSGSTKGQFHDSSSGTERDRQTPTWRSEEESAREVLETDGRALTLAEILAQEEDGGPETEFERQQFIFFMTMRNPPY